MKTMGGNMKVLGDMAKGATPFDAEAAQAALAKIHEASLEIPAKFEVNEIPAKSEALPKIWEDWDGFTAKAKGLQDVSQKSMETTIGTAADIGPVLGALGGACKDCHSEYRSK